MVSLSEERNAELISVIVPVYQVHEYISDCITSLRNQTYQNLEIILVDDGSEDGSGEICDIEAKKDERIKVIHQENAGLSEARNVGIRMSKGEYIAFVDSDDLVSDRFVETLYQLIRKYDADISVCDYSRDYLKKQNAKEYAVSSKKMLAQWHGKRKRIETVCWNKLYKRSVLINDSGEIFPIGKKHEDVYTSHIFVEKADKIAITDDKLYLYRERKNSITFGKTRQQLDDELKAQRERLSYFWGNRYYTASFRLIICHIFYWLKCVMRN